jgi:hypothetical protein
MCDDRIKQLGVKLLVAGEFYELEEETKQFIATHQLADRVSFDWRWNTEKEYTLGVSYAVTKQLYISGNYDAREKFGIGLNLKF